jgi:hypothetical protein
MSRRSRFRGNQRSGPWYFQFVEVLRFMGSARNGFPGLRHRVSKDGLAFWVRLLVPGYEARNVRVLFSPSFPRYPVVTADGPTESRHRNGDGSLCLWYPKDGEDRRWVFSDGLPQLLAITTLHLFKEAWWRETGGLDGGEWLGDEVHTEAPKTSEPTENDAG